jgi:hypothetical protein
VPSLDPVTGLVGGLTGALGGGAVGGGLPVVSQTGLAGVPGQLPVVPEQSRTDVSPVPDLGSVTGLVGGLTGGRLPSVGGLVPVLPAAGSIAQPAVPGVPATLPGVGEQPALNGLDTSTVLAPAHLTDSASLADTRSELSRLLGEQPIG